MLEELDPARRAARELRQGDLRVLAHERLVEAQDELGALLDDGEVGGEVRVEHAVEADAPQGGVHLEGDRRAGLEAEELAHGRSRRRRRLDDDVLVGIVDGRPDIVRLVLGVERPGGAAVDALAAVDAGGVEQGQLGEGLDRGRVAAPDRLEHADLLEVDAGAHAAAAADALVHVAHHGVARQVGLGHRRVGMAEGELGDAVLLGQRLQLAVAVAHAAVALAVVLAEQELEHVPASQPHAAAVRVDAHLVGHGEGARGLQEALPLDLDDADAAHAGDVEVRMVAQRRDADARSLGSLQDGRPEGDLGLVAVDGHAHIGADGVRAGGRDHAPVLLRERRAMDGGGGIAHAHSLVTRALRGS